MRFAILGGDRRQYYLRKLLEDEGYTVSKIPSYNNEVVIGPTPCSKDGLTLFQETEDNPVVIEELFQKMRDNKRRLFIAGAIKDNVHEMATEYDIEAIDLMALDEVAIMNAVPTAEGVIAAAMENSDITLFGSRCLVLGYGRCGKILANMLNGIGGKVSVGARYAEDEAFVKCLGLDLFALDTMKTLLKEFDFIFNTVPSMLLDRSTLGYLNPNCMVIDIASVPGGVDFEAAKEMGILAINLPGLPGKVAPKTAAIILKDAIIKLLIQRGL
jgi:dipicolinate synthase subunit A